MSKRLSTWQPVWLLGAGSSVGCGMPTTGELTDLVVSGTPIWRDTQEVYHIGEAPSPMSPLCETWTALTRSLLSEVTKLVDDYYRGADHAANYEDLSYVVQQVADSASGEYDNPGTGPLIRDLDHRLQGSLESLNDLARRHTSLPRLASEASNLILDIVRAELGKRPPGCLSVLDCVVDCCGQASRTSRAKVFTLNHDRVLESALCAGGIAYCDGFVDEHPGVRYWTPTAFMKPRMGVDVYKLHGSVDWRRLRPRATEPHRERVGIVEGRSWESLVNPAGERLEVLDAGRPRLLLGTFNKMMEYTGHVFFDLHWHFVRALRATTRLIICGYGFGDKGINRFISRWVDSEADNLLVVIDPDVGSLRGRARPLISRNWSRWLSHGRVVEVPEVLENVTWSSLRSAI